MPTYDILPVYKTSYDLLLAIFNFSQSLTREYKYTIGDNLKTETVAMITNIYRANSTQINRYDRIQSARENLEVIRLFLRLLKDLKQISLTKFIMINESIESISKQLTAWKNHS
jgi:hypothetical protein